MPAPQPARRAPPVPPPVRRPPLARKRLGRARRQGATGVALRKWRTGPGRDVWRDYVASFAAAGLVPAPGGRGRGRAVAAAQSPEPEPSAAVLVTENSAAVLLPPEQRLTFTGRCRLRCLHGSARVLGFAVTPEQPAYDLFSPLTHCALSVEALRRAGPARPRARARKEARAALRDHGVPRDARRKLMERFTPACSVVLLERLDTPVTRFILSYPDFSHLFRAKKQRVPCFIPEDAALASVGILKCDPESGLIVSESTTLAIEELVQACREENDGVPVVLVCGPKCVGKSTFNRYFINMLLNHLPCVEYLECDLGQTEFTPPGCVSLMNISDPFLGPPFTHQRTPRKMVYYGDVSCDQDTERYIDTVKYVFNSYKKEVPLVINTMGWVKGVGLLLLIDIIRLLSPSHIVQISAEDFKDMPQLTPEYIHLTAGLHTKGKLQATCKSMDMSGTENWQPCEGERDFQTSTPGHKLLYVKPKFPGAGDAAKARVHSSILRDMAMLGYLGQLQPLETRSVLPLHSLIPYQVPFSAVALRVIHTDVAPKHIIYSVNASWVGLCRIPDEVRCQTDGPVLLTQTPVCDCLGFGIVRGVEMEKKLYHILTPVPPENLRVVNCLLLGNIAIPSCVLLNQGIEGEIPYVTSEYNYRISGAGKLKVKKHLQRREYSRP